MTIFKKLYYFFSVYSHKAEKDLAKFFNRLDENQSPISIADRLIKLIQQDIVILNVFLEWRYKGYKYLNKKTRKILCQNAILIKQDFERYCQQSSLDYHHIFSQLDQLGIKYDKVAIKKDELVYLKNIMDYLSPNNGLYVYQATSTFGNLLKNPANEKLSADCNQIVTLYIYLYSQRYNVTDLKLLSLPKHVAIDFCGLGIEATSGSFIAKSINDKKILPVQEIVSINLLDISDSNFKTYKITPELILQSSRMAYIISSNRDIVVNNLSSAYKKITQSLIDKNDYHKALDYAKRSRDQELISYTGHNAAVYYMDKNNFKLAKKFANYYLEKQKLLTTIYHNQGIYCLNHKKYLEAIKAFSQIRRDDLVRKCYVGLFHQEQSKLGSKFTSETIRQNKAVIANMKSYAKKSGDSTLIDYVRKLEKYL